MKKMFAGCIAVILSCLFAVIGASEKDAKAASGEAGFKQHCAICHPDGGNIINPQKTLHKKDLDAGQIRRAEDIIQVVRKGAPSMPALDKNTVSDEEATAIANYIWNTFK